MWVANFTGVPVEGLYGLVHDGDTVTTIQQQQRRRRRRRQQQQQQQQQRRRRRRQQQQQQQQQQRPKLSGGKCQERISQRRFAKFVKSRIKQCIYSSEQQRKFMQHSLGSP